MSDNKDLDMASAVGTGLPMNEAASLSSPSVGIPDAELKIAFLESENDRLEDDLRAVRAVKDDHFRNAQRLASENSGLRIALWNGLRRVGVAQDRAIQIVRDAAQGMSTGTAKTAQPVEGEACQPDPKGCAHDPQ